MKITYLGHACFLLETQAGKRILIDPYNEQVGYPMQPVSADLVLISHEHFDHNHVALASGSPRVIRGLQGEGRDWADVRETVDGIEIRTVRTYHDDTQGSQRGKNAMFWVVADGLRILHAGDLGHALDPQAATQAQNPDIFLVPVGGYYTIDAATADRVIAQINPRVVIPMHYRTEVNRDWPISPLDPFLANKQNIKRVGHTVEIQDLPATREIWVMDWKA
ncbi:MAG: MBL fold metallo-hydrolase [Armatimonadota bacterium]|nr:MBL fold metallo-hydrolase [Armatimonadota bacterium]MDR7440115.1 MBL fold metallo-hydrolase [Armatimonadota bacterium]MDR7562386.1 MBL fold metallo-hydrolase [Armatimonadota bacterium]MDR7567067.1 MBL fold metallo-hydrolase [Armatimonadota bacterium]MDR7601532.1 MBL fold metallo-hydrolase [Armatimonadota bacterium]